MTYFMQTMEDALHYYTHVRLRRQRELPRPFFALLRTSRQPPNRENMG